MATLDIDLISTYIVPIVVYTAICCALTLAIALGFCKLFCKDEWFEKAIMAFGVGTGNTATGLALVRAVDRIPTPVHRITTVCTAQLCAGRKHSQVSFRCGR